MSVPSFTNLKKQAQAPAQDNRTQVGFTVTKEEHDVLQQFANEMYNQIIEHPETHQKIRMLERPQIGLMVKLATYYYMQMFQYHMAMQKQAQNNPQVQQALNTIANQLNIGNGPAPRK